MIELLEFTCGRCGAVNRLKFERVLQMQGNPRCGGCREVLLSKLSEPLDALDPLAKQVMVEAVTDAVSHDGRVSVAEAELLRTICGVLHCPLPPMLESS